MVQAALTALAPAAGNLLGAFGNQSRRELTRPTVSSGVPAISAAGSRAQARRIQDEIQRERIYNLLMQPEVLGTLMALGGIIASNRIPFSSDPETNILLQGISTTLTTAMGMGYAGVGDLTSLSVAIAAGGSTILGSILGDSAGGSGLLDTFWKIHPLGALWNLIT